MDGKYNYKQNETLTVKIQYERTIQLFGNDITNYKKIHFNYRDNYKNKIGLCFSEKKLIWQRKESHKM